MNRRHLLLLSVMAPALSRASDTVALIEGGSVFLVDASGRRTRFQHEGTATQAVVSRGGEAIAILSVGEDGRRALRVEQLGGQKERRGYTIAEPVSVQDYQLKIKSVAWSPSRGRLYLLLDFTSTSDFLAYLDLADGAVRAASDVVLFSFVSAGEYAGKIIALKRKQTLTRPWDWYWLLDEDGREIGPIGSQEDLAEFRDRFEPHGR